MALRTQRFGVRNAIGARSSEWVVMWKTNTSDVYLASRTLGGIMKASFHQSGRCHVRSPDAKFWHSEGTPPAFLFAWNIDPLANYNFPFSLVIPEQELRIAEWAIQKDKGTIWIQASPNKGVEIAIFLVRTSDEVSHSLRAKGWHTCIVDALLPDGRKLIVVAGEAVIPQDRLNELETTKIELRRFNQQTISSTSNLRLVLLTDTNSQGTRSFVEAAV